MTRLTRLLDDSKNDQKGRFSGPLAEGPSHGSRYIIDVHSITGGGGRYFNTIFIVQDRAVLPLLYNFIKAELEQSGFKTREATKPEIEGKIFPPERAIFVRDKENSPVAEISVSKDRLFVTENRMVSTSESISCIFSAVESALAKYRL